MEIVADYIREHHKGITEVEIQEITYYRAKTFIRQMGHSKNPSCGICNAALYYYKDFIIRNFIYNNNIKDNIS